MTCVSVVSFVLVQLAEIRRVYHGLTSRKITEFLIPHTPCPLEVADHFMRPSCSTPHPGETRLQLASGQ